jgi:para-nitrobenzyl esterase
MVWFHGGDFEYSSGSEWLFDGTNLALENDVVVVTVNHRLSILGFMHLGDLGGSEFRDSGNAGNLDLIAALEWVRDNISAFGGDPGNVTIFGVSGGAWKTTMMLSMPAAKGLFHKAIIQSGPRMPLPTREAATRLAQAVISTVGLKPNQLTELQRLPVEQLILAMKPALHAASVPLHRGFRPLVDGVNLPFHPTDDRALSFQDDVPVIIGSTKDEAAYFGANDPKLWNRTLTDEELKSRVVGLAGAQNADAAIALYRETFPEKNPSELYLAISSDCSTWSYNISQAERKHRRGAAPVYVYLFSWELKVFDGRFLACHASDVAFTFDNLDLAPNLTDRGPQVRALAAKISQGYAEFARSGHAGGQRLPQWPAYGSEQRATMVYDDECRVIMDLHPRLREFWSRLEPEISRPWTV